ncbi:MAG: cell surface hyaluronidase [Candidatus Binatota bacterium]|jgi:hypothetical protein|nr:cell surface hyaluronidase [Candidatus Binatota bacterium]
MRKGWALGLFAAMVCAVAALAPAQSSTPLPVIVTVDDTKDARLETSSTAVHDLHVQENVPIVFDVIPCGGGSTGWNGSGSEPTGSCVNETGTDAFHKNYRTWILAKPTLIEIAQHGRAHIQTTEDLAGKTAEQQMNIVGSGLDVMDSADWNLPDRPFTFAAPFSAIDSTTFQVLSDLGFHIGIKNSGSCPTNNTNLVILCDSVPLCVDTDGVRDSGPACHFRTPAEVIADINSRASEGVVFLNYHVQDLYECLNATDCEFDQESDDPSPSKQAALQDILQALRGAEVDGDYDLMLAEQYYDLVTTSATNTPTRTGTQASPTPTRTGTVQGSPTPTRTGTAQSSPTPTRTPALTGTPTRTRTAVATATRTRTAVATATRTRTAVATATRTRTAAPTGTATRRPTRTRTPEPTATGTRRPTRTRTPTIVPSATPTRRTQALTCQGRVVTMSGTRAGETINGTPGNDVIHGLGGNDRIDGQGGDDLICGGAGDDTIFGHAGRDLLFGQGGDDVIRGGAGNDRLIGGSGHDRLLGGGGNDTLLGGSGRDTCRGGSGENAVNCN